MSIEEKLNSIRNEMSQHPRRFLVKSFLIPGYMLNIGIKLPKNEDDKKEENRKRTLRYAAIAETAKITGYGLIIYKIAEQLAK